MTARLVVPTFGRSAPGKSAIFGMPVSELRKSG
jgi:hypothetical protein